MQEHNKLRIGTTSTNPTTRLLDNKRKEQEEARNETTKAASGQPAARQHKRVRTVDSDLPNCEADVEASGNKEDGEQSEDGEDPHKQAAASQHVMLHLFTPKPPNVAGGAGGGGGDGVGSGSSQRQSQPSPGSQK